MKFVTLKIILISLLLVLGVNIYAQNTGIKTKTDDTVVYLDVGSAGVRKLRIAIPQFYTYANSFLTKDELLGYQKRLKDLLEFTGSFEILPESTYVSSADASAKPIFYNDWESIKSEGVALVVFKPSVANKLTMEASYYSVQKQKRLVGKAFSDLEKADIDAVIRRFADFIIEVLTGELGMFSTKLAFIASKGPGQPKHVYVSNFDGSGIRQVTNGNTTHMSPSWSPDGRKLTFTSFKDAKAEIYVYNFETGKTLRMTKSVGNNSGAAWHPNGKLVAFAGAVDGKTSIYTIRSIDGGERTELISDSSGLNVEPSFSPDGQKIAFASGRFGNPHVFIRDLSKKNDTRITFAGWYNSSPSWRSDAKKLAFAGYDREIDRYDIFIVNSDGSTLERLTLDQGDNEKPSWSPDGRFIVFQSNRLNNAKGKTRQHKLYIMNKDGANQQLLALPSYLYDITMPSWGPRLNMLIDR